MPLENLLLEHVSVMFQFIHTYNEEENSDTGLRQSAGLIGDLADTFPNGQLRDALLQDWVASMLKTKIRNPDVKKTLRWAREVSICQNVPNFWLTKK